MVDFQKVIRRMTSIQAKQRIKQSRKPLIIQFFSHSCDSCVESGPLLQKAVDEAGEAVEVISVDGDFSQEFADEFGVDGYPTAVGFRNGQKVAAFEGGGDEADYSKFFARCARPKPLKKAKSKPTSKPRQKPKPKPKPRARKKAKLRRKEKTDA